MASVRKRGKSYQITVFNGRDIYGDQIKETATFVPDKNKTEKQNKKALDKFVFEFEEKVRSGKYLDGEKMTFKAFSEIWLDKYAKDHLEDKTIDTYEGFLNKHILPEIGHLNFSKVQPLHLNDLYSLLLKERKDGKPGGYAPKTIRHIHTLISSIYNTAVQWNVVIQNPCSRVTPPKLTRRPCDIKHFTYEQAEKFIKLINSDYITYVDEHDRVDDTGNGYHVPDYFYTRSYPTQFKLFFLMDIFCGMRRGEMIALEWGDLDFKNNTVSITRNTVIRKGGPLTKAPKTPSSIRTISVPTQIMALAKKYRREQLKYRMSLGDKWAGGDYLFIQWDGSQMYPSTPTQKFKSIIKRYNESITDKSEAFPPDITLHGLRHTSVTLLISLNVDPRTVAARHGHAQVSTTLDIYSHSLKKKDEEAADALSGLLNNNISKIV